LPHFYKIEVSMTMFRRGLSASAILLQTALYVIAFGVAAGRAQGLGGAGTVQGTVKDPTGGVMVAVDVALSNPVTGLKRDATTDAMGRFAFRNLPPNPYHLVITAQGFQTLEQNVDVNTAVPIDLDLMLQIGQTASVDVVGHGELVEQDPTAHTDIDQSLIDKLPLQASGGLSGIITLASPGVVADSNGFFHPVGDHAQTQFSIDNQPVTDQQSRLYSNQISSDAVQSMEIITGVPPAEFGDKDSLVVRIVTKSGLDQAKLAGSVSASYGSFKSPSGEVNLGDGNGTVGNFISLSGLQTERFLDPPEFTAIHDKGNSQSFFDRLDLRPNNADALHLNVQASQSSFDVPNTFDQADAGQAQHQKITTFNIAPGYTRVLNSRTLMTANAYVRRDHLTYTPSADPLADATGTVSQDRKLTNFGAKVDVGYTQGANNVKIGASFTATKLDEQFSLGLTDPTENSPCVDASGNPSDNTGLTSLTQCTGVLSANPGFVPGLAPFDLTRGGGLFNFTGAKTIKGQALYAQDDITAGNASIRLGLRFDHYDGFVTKSLIEPRVGLSYSIPMTHTVLRGSYGRTLETPYNENLILSSQADPAIFGTGGVPLPPGTRDQLEGGIEQAFGGWLVADVGYFYKKTKNAYDFGEIFSTPIFFPVSWDHSKLYGFTGRINLVEHKGFSAFTVLAHTNALFFPPGTGGLLLDAPTGEFRIDHDQKFNQTTNVQYVFVKSVGAWAALSWRYDSGLVAGAVTDYATALGFSGDDQAAIGLYCGSTFATRDAPITSCSSPNRGATRLNIPADGAENDVTNPPRVAPRSLFDLGFGVDNLFQSGKAKVRVRFSILNVTNKEALYNFQSTFSGTHFVTPRSYQAQVGITF
jgi:hypothetical protein